MSKSLGQVAAEDYLKRLRKQEKEEYNFMRLNDWAMFIDTAKVIGRAGFQPKEGFLAECVKLNDAVVQVGRKRALSILMGEED